MAPSPGQMTDQLTARLDGPHSDEDTTAAAQVVAEAVRFLNYATTEGAGLSYPAAAYAVTAGLASAATWLCHPTGQLGQFLVRELDAGRAGDDAGADPANVTAFSDVYLAAAATADVALGEAFSAAQSYLVGLHQTDACPVIRPELAAVHEATA